MFLLKKIRLWTQRRNSGIKMPAKPILPSNRLVVDMYPKIGLNSWTRRAGPRSLRRILKASFLRPRKMSVTPRSETCPTTVSSTKSLRACLYLWTVKTRRLITPRKRTRAKCLTTLTIRSKDKTKIWMKCKKTKKASDERWPTSTEWWRKNLQPPTNNRSWMRRISTSINLSCRHRR